MEFWDILLVAGPSAEAGYFLDQKLTLEPSKFFQDLGTTNRSRSLRAGTFNPELELPGQFTKLESKCEPNLEPPENFPALHPETSM